VVTDEDFREGDDVFGLGVIEADGFYMFFEFFKAEAEHFLRGVSDM
jgi:hypothetical protein